MEKCSVIMEFLDTPIVLNKVRAFPRLLLYRTTISLKVNTKDTILCNMGTLQRGRHHERKFITTCS